MKNLISLVVISICLAACTSSREMKNNENIELVKQYVAAVVNMDFEAMEEFLSDDYMGIGPSYGDSIRKQEAVENWKLNVKNLYEEIQYNKSRYAAITIIDGENEGE